jgi:hypothetical protein
MTPARRARLALICWLVGLGAALVALLHVGADHPSSPPLFVPTQWAGWVALHEPLDVASGVARVIALALVVHLLLVTAAQLFVTLVRPAAGHRVIHRSVPRFVAVLTAAALTSSVPPGVHATEPTTTVAPGLGASLVPVDPAGHEPHSPAPDGDPVTSLPRAPGSEAHPQPDRTGKGGDVGATTSAGSPPPSDPVRPAEGDWTVRPGDHLWSIAAHVVASSGGDAADDRVVGRYWVHLVEANRDRLVEPDDPDLILPGQRLRLP